MACPATLLQVINSIQPATPSRQSTLGRTLGLTKYIFHLEHRGGVRSQSGPKLKEGLPFPFRWILGHGARRSRTELISLPLLGGTQISRESGWD